MDVGQSDFTDPPPSVKYVIGSPRAWYQRLPKSRLMSAGLWSRHGARAIRKIFEEKRKWSSSRHSLFKIGPADIVNVASVIFSSCLTYEGRAPLFKARSGNRDKMYRRMNVGAVNLRGPFSWPSLISSTISSFRHVQPMAHSRNHKSNFKSQRNIFKKINADKKSISHLI